MNADALRAAADAAVQAVAELPDRTSPDDWPEAMLVTADELRAIVKQALVAALPEPLPEPKVRRMRDGVLVPCTLDEFHEWLTEVADRNAHLSTALVNVVHLASAAFGVALAHMAAALPAPPTWQPIETMPPEFKDGREVLLMVELRAGIPHQSLVGHWMPGGYCIEDHPPIGQGWYFWNGCMFDHASKPTHWQPLPLPPVVSHTEESH